MGVRVVDLYFINSIDYDSSAAKPPVTGRREASGQSQTLPCCPSPAPRYILRGREESLTVNSSDTEFEL